MKSEVLRYLGRKNQEVPEGLSGMIDECIALMHDTAAPRHISREFKVSPGAGCIALDGTGILLPGKDIARHLRGCDRAVLMAATLGAQTDALIQKWGRADLTRALVLDACATRLTEEYCDEIEREIRAQATAFGFMAARRFSPGYGDLPLDIQPRILDVLNACRQIGLTCTESLILLPRKSVTAIIGLGEKLSLPPGGCAGCAMNHTCDFRKDGSTNECPRADKE